MTPSGPPLPHGETLEERESRLRAILDTAVDGIITITEAGIIDSFNPAAETIFGYAAAEVVGTNVTRLMPAPHRDQHDQYVRDYLETGIKRIIGIGREMEGVRKDGSRFPLDLSVSEFRTSAGRRFAGMIRDISNRKRTETALRESQRTLMTLIGNLPGIVYRANNDPGWAVTYIGGQCLELTGYDAPDFTEGRVAFGKLIHPFDRDRVWNDVQAALESRTTFELEYRIVTASQSEKWVWERGCGVFDGDDLRFLEGFITDITERKVAEAQIRQQEKLAAVGQLASGVAHEVGNPLASISAVTQNLARKTNDRGIRRKLALIEDHIERVIRTVRQMVDFARPTQTEWRLCCINAIVDEALQMVRYDKRARAVSVEMTLAPDLPETQVMPELLEQVFINLSLNAFDALAGLKDGERRIRIHTSYRSGPRQEVIRISFEDSGSGIPPEIESRIWEPFFTTKEVGKGTGLGLAVSHGIVREHGGQILVDGRPGRGARFVVEVPVRPEPPPPPADDLTRSTFRHPPTSAVE